MLINVNPLISPEIYHLSGHQHGDKFVLRMLIFHPIHRQ